MHCASRRSHDQCCVCLDGDQIKTPRMCQLKVNNVHSIGRSQAHSFLTCTPLSRCIVKVAQTVGKAISPCVRGVMRGAMRGG